MAILNIRYTPDPKPDIPRKTKGKSSGMGVCEFWRWLFELNEGLSQTNKMTDAEILRLLQVEFPDRPSAWQAVKEGRRPVGHYRCRYNSGALGGRPGPSRIKSYRYDKVERNGKLVMLRINGTTRKPLPDNQQQRKQSKKKK